jgi:hypothetical protein
MLPSEAFLSHSSQDRTFPRRLADVLGSHGVPVWYSPVNIIGAQQWHDQIGKALGRCDWFVLILSRHSVNSRWVTRELLFALNDARYEDRIVPLYYRPCKESQLSWVLPTFQRIDFTSDFRAGCRDLLRIWGLGYDSPGQSSRRARKGISSRK